MRSGDRDETLLNRPHGGVRHQRMALLDMVLIVTDTNGVFPGIHAVAVRFDHLSRQAHRRIWCSAEGYRRRPSLDDADGQRSAARGVAAAQIEPRSGNSRNGFDALLQGVAPRLRGCDGISFPKAEHVANPLFWNGAQAEEVDGCD